MRRASHLLSAVFALVSSSAWATQDFSAQWSSTTSASVNGGGQGRDSTQTLFTSAPNLVSATLSGYGTASSSVIFGSRIPSVNANATWSGTSSAYGVAGNYGSLSYYFEVTGPNSTSPLSIYLSTRGHAYSTGDSTHNHGSEASASLSIGGDGIEALYSVVSNYGISSQYSSLLLNNQSISLFANNAIGVTLQYNVQGTTIPSEYIPTISEGAYIDPYFSLPASLTAAGYHIDVLSPGIGNNPIATPEPSVWAMMLMGFAGLCFAGYCQKRKLRVLGGSRHAGINCHSAPSLMASDTKQNKRTVILF